MFKHKNTRVLKLSFQGKVLRELPLSEVKEGFSLGRGSSCDWVFPTEDRLVSTKHAVIERKFGQWTLVDAESKNGVYAGGQRVARCKLIPGETISIGQCELTVTDSEAKALQASVRVPRTAYYRLEPLSRTPKVEITVRKEALRGRDWIDVKEPIFKVGSDSSCELCIKDPHVSHIHAIFTQDERGFFLTPQKTTNPTSVNRETSAPGIKRMLRDNDVVSFAFYDFRFLDKHVKHTRSYLWVKVTAAVVTLAVLLAGYFAYLWGTASAGELLQRARSLAAREHFETAKTTLEEASHAREYMQYQQQLNELADQLAVWERTSSDWQSVQESLKTRHWSDAVRRLSTMRCERMENWNWNENSALAARQQALVVKEVLDVFVMGYVLTNSPERKVENVIATRDRLTALLEGKSLPEDALFAPFREDAACVRDVLSSDLNQHQRYERALSQLDSPDVDFAALIVELNELSTNSTEWVSRRIPGVLAPVKKLQAVATGLRENMRAVHRLAFADVVKTLPWPSPDECSVHPNLGVQREYLEKSNNAILASARQVEHLMATFRRLGVTPPQTPELVARTVDHARWEAVFACGVLKGKLPNRMRREPADDYDRLLGVESFYEVLYTQPETTGEDAMVSLAFTPELVTLRQLFSQFQVYLDYVKKDAWVAQGEGVLAQTKTFCERMLSERDKLVAWLYRSGDMETSPRSSLIGRCAALYLAPDGMYDTQVRIKLAADFKRFRAAIQKMNQAYDGASSSPEESIRIRDRILSEGLPGDSVVRRMWAKKE